MKMNSSGIVFAEQVERMHERILVAEESGHAVTLLRSDVLETVGRGLGILLHERLGDDELLHAVGPRVLERLLAYHSVLRHGLAHLESRVHQYAVVALQLLGIHASHRRTDD